MAMPFEFFFFFENSGAYTLEAVISVLCGLSWPLRAVCEPLSVVAAPWDSQNTADSVVPLTGSYCSLYGFVIT